MRKRIYSINLVVLISILVFLHGCISLHVDNENRSGDKVYSIMESDIPADLKKYVPELNNFPSRVIGTGAIDPISKKNKAALNLLRTSYYRTVEKDYYNSSSSHANKVRKQLGLQPVLSKGVEGLPKVCLAMSGGGIRSAAFNIGVLQGLNSTDPSIVDSIDIISSVSGGSYANSWLLAQRMLGNESFDSLLDENSESIKYLEDNAENFINKWTSSMSTILTYIFQPILALAGLIPGVTQVDIAGIGYYVEINNLFFKSKDRTSLQKIPFEDVAGFLSNETHPFPIFNGTFQERKESCDNFSMGGYSDLDRRVFEMTPLRMGTESVGFSDFFVGNRDNDLTGVVMVSGAALDRASESTCSLMRLIGFQTGAGYKDLITSSTVLPEIRDSNRVLGASKNVHIVDGGFSDNLGVYPLVKRMCQTIIVIDAEHDPGLKFESYFKLQSYLRDKVGIELQINSIENYNGIVSNTGDFLADNFSYPVSTGSIKHVEFPNGLKVFSDVLYVKLSMQKWEMNNYPLEVKKYFENQDIVGCNGKGLRQRCQFPQQSTSHQSFSPEEFRAYRILGKQIIENHL